MSWEQYALRLPACRRGVHLITSQVIAGAPTLSEFSVGLLHLFLQHTSASLSLNENADPDVRADMETALNAIVSEELPFRHTLEGPDDMPAHVKASLIGSSVNILIDKGRLSLGTWQGIFFCEFDGPRNRRAFIKVFSF